MRNNVLLLFIVCAFAVTIFYITNKAPLVQTDFASQQVVAPKIRTYRGPIDDCLQTPFLYAKRTDLEADCNSNYVHFYPNSKMKGTNLQRRPSKEIKIGSYNLFHLGDTQAVLKNLDLVALVMNRWDLVGAQELMPLSVDFATNNTAVAGILMNPTNDPIPIVPPVSNWRLNPPGYLQLLFALQKLDSSWALILQPTPAGEGNTGEMAGFYYRSSKVELKEWNYCPTSTDLNPKTNQPFKNLACLAQIPEETKKLISRTAFAAYFQSKKFDFIGLTTHIRFNRTLVEADLNLQTKELCDKYVNPSKCRIAKDDAGRYYEVYAIAQQMAEIQTKTNEKDILFMGDFNLQLQDGTKEDWNAALKAIPGFEVMQTDPTTLSLPNKRMASNFDHFIFNPGSTKSCDPKTVQSFNYLTRPRTSDPVTKTIQNFLNLTSETKWVDWNKQRLNNLVRFQNNPQVPLRLLNEKERKDFTDAFDLSLKRMQQSPYAAILELMSDHVPVEMTCRTDIED